MANIELTWFVSHLYSSSSMFFLSIKVIKVLNLLWLSIAILDLRNQSNLNWVGNILFQFIIYIFFVESMPTNQETIIFFSIVFPSVSTIWCSQLMKGCFVPTNLGVKCFSDTNSSLNSCLSPLIWAIILSMS